jgi:hypothetical protein
VAALAAALAPGCVTVSVDWPGKAKDKAPAETVALPDGASQAKAEKKADGGVKQAAAFLPAGPVISPSIAKMFSKGEAAKADTLLTLWGDRVAYLPDPTKNGAEGAGIVGQMFLFSPDMKFVTADGSLTVEMYDDTGRAGRREPVFLGKWTLDKDTLRRLVTSDERWGKCYALFLPWPDYKADITRVKLSARYDQEGGHTIYAKAATVTFNTNLPGMNASSSPFSSTSPIGGPPPASYLSPGLGVIPSGFPAAGAPSTPVNLPVGGSGFSAPQNLPVGGPAATSAAQPLPIAPTQPQGPGGLPPLAIIAQPR